MATRSGSRYIPGQSIDVSRAISESEWKNPDAYAMAAVVEDGFLHDPMAERKAILLLNLSGQTATFIQQDVEEFNRLYGNQRYNQYEEGGVTLPPGRASHFPASTECYIVSIYEELVGENAQIYRETLLGKRLNELENVAVLVRNGRVPNRLIVSTSANNYQDNYFTVENHSSKRIHGLITREDTAYSKDPITLRQERLSRSVDLGGHVIKEFEIDSGAILHYHAPQLEYCIRALEPCQPPTTGTLGGRGIIIAPRSDYVEEAKCKAFPGDICILFADETKNGGTRLVPFDMKNVKKVKSSIAVTLFSQ